MGPTPLTTLRDLLDAAAARGTAPAVIACRADGMDTLSCADLAREAHALAARLLRAGVRHGEPVVLLGPNSIRWIVSYFGITAAGALPVPLDHLATGRDLAAIVADCAARRAFTTQRHAELLRTSGAPPLEITRLADAADWPETDLPAGRTSDLPGLLPHLDSGDTASLLYTSGTTGTPKGVPLAHRNFTSNVEALVATRLIGPGDRVLVPLPLHHSYPFTCGLLASLATGAAVVLPEGVTGPQLIAAIKGASITVLLGVPRLYTALLAGIEAKAGARPLNAWLFRNLLALSGTLARVSGLRAGRVLFRRLHQEMGPTLRILGSGGAPLDPDVAWKLEGLGWEVLSGYGLTETSPILTFNIRGQVRHGAAGRPVPGVTLRVDAPPGQKSGEILAKGPGVFAGYRNNPEASGAAFTPDGWFHTGDIGFLDADGFLHISGRVKEMIVLPDGKKVFPEVVEEAFAAIPLIREVAVLEHGGRLVALLVPDEEAIRRRGAARIENSMREAIEAVSLGLPAHQRITDYRISHAGLPRTPLGKLQRFHLPGIYAGGRAAAGATAQATLSEADRELLASGMGERVWAWLRERFPDKPLSLDASPQLDLNVDSLEWLTLTLEIRDRLSVNLTQEAVARILTVRDLLAEVIAAGSAAGDGAAAAAIGEVTPDQVRWLEPPGPVLQAVAFLLYGFNRMIMRLAFRLRVEGVAALPDAGPLLIAPNHSSYLDPMAVAAALPWRLLRQTHWAGWTGFMFRTWYWRALSRVMRVFPVDPDRGPASAIASGAAVLSRGDSLIWFAEGRRTLTGAINPFLPGVGVLLGRTGSPVLPVRVEGSYAVLPWNRHWPRPGRITVTLGAPVSVSELESAGEGATAPERVATGLRKSVIALGHH